MVIAVALTASPAITPALAGPYPTPTRDGRETIQRIGTCPTGFVGLGDKCVALHENTPHAMPKVKGAACPPGYFASGAYCKALR
jgi:hypothetical protein